MALKRRPRGWRSLVAALRDPARSEFAFVPHQYVFAPTELVTASLSASETTPINGAYKNEFPVATPYTDDNHTSSSSNDRRCCSMGALRQQANRFFVLHAFAIGMASFCCVWLTLFPISPNRLYNMQVDVFNTDHEHTNFFFKQCLFLGMILGAAAAGYLGDHLGRAGTLELSAVPYIIGWLLLAVSYSEITVLIGRYLLGVASGMMSVIAPIYVAEISAVHVRGRMLSVQTLFAALGRICYLGIGALFLYLSRQYFGFNLSEWKVLAMIGLFPGLALLLLMQQLPDSPTWLIIRHDDREAAFSILHKLYSDDYRQAEQQVNSIIHAHVLSRQDHTHHGAFFRPLILCCALFTLRAITTYLVDPTLSPTPVQTFMVTIFGVGIDISEVQLLGVMSYLWLAAAIGMICCFLVIDVRGRVMALQSGCGIVVVGCLLVLVNAYRQHKSSLLVTDTGSATLLLITAGHQLGLGIGPLVLVSELFPARQRLGAVSIVCIVEALVNLALAYMFPMMRAHLALQEVFMVSVVLVLLCNASGIIIAWFYLPETSQRSLQAIEAIFSGWYPETPKPSHSRVRLSTASTTSEQQRSRTVYGTA